MVGNISTSNRNTDILKCDLSPYLMQHIYDGMNCTLKNLPVLSPWSVIAVKLKILILLKVGLGSWEDYMKEMDWGAKENMHSWSLAAVINETKRGRKIQD